jgi:hypothetical protein
MRQGFGAPRHRSFEPRGDLEQKILAPGDTAISQSGQSDPA